MLVHEVVPVLFRLEIWTATSLRVAEVERVLQDTVHAEVLAKVAPSGGSGHQRVETARAKWWDANG